MPPQNDSFDDNKMLSHVSDYMQTLYRHLRLRNDQLNKLNQDFMDLASAEGGDSEKLVALRKQIAGMGIYQKLFGDF